MEGSRSPDEMSNNGDCDQEQKINIFLKVDKTVCVSVKKSDCVRDVKAILDEKEGISEISQNLFFSGEYLGDFKKLVDCGIQENSMVQVFVQDFVPLILFIRPLSHPKVIVIESRPNNTIENVKSAIMAKEGTHSCSFNLIYRGQELEKDRTLESLGVGEGSTLHMVTAPQDAVTVTVKFFNVNYENVYKIEVKRLYSVRDVKIVVESISGYSVRHLDLVYNGLRLDDLKSLCSYDVAEESILEIVPKRIRIFVRKMSGKRGRYDVDPEDDVIYLMEKIAARERHPLNCLYLTFQGVRLDDRDTLASYNIKDGSALDLMVDINR